MEKNMSANFTEVVQNAQEGLEVLKANEAQAALNADPNTMILDVRDEGDLNLTGIIPGTVNVSMGTLYFKADHNMPAEFQDPNLGDKDRPIITTCTLGMVACIAAKTLKDYGFKNVKVLEGGNQAWKEAGLPLEEA
ncbi:MAG: sulfurtransferase [Myxococcales bacterium]|nr:sulfurtransferase [Myxococcales bacterium]|tara:strand:- start:441 stop:848 length:408 start_codon:yes stop_codon:yes gene_type:complete